MNFGEQNVDRPAPGLPASNDPALDPAAKVFSKNYPTSRMNPGDQGLNRAARELPASDDLALDPAFEDFYRKYQAGWIRYAFIETGDMKEAERIIDGLTAHIAKYWHDDSHSTERAAQHAWRVLKATIACWLDEHATESAFVRTSAFDRAIRRVLARAGEKFAEMEESIGLFSAISHLPGRQRESIILRFVLGFQYDEIERMLGVPEATVRVNICHAKKRIAKELGRPDLIKTKTKARREP